MKEGLKLVLMWLEQHCRDFKDPSGLTANEVHDLVMLLKMVMLLEEEDSK